MVFVVFLIFAAFAICAAVFVCWPIVGIAGGGRASLLLIGALSTLVLGIGVGAYLILGSPYLAVRALSAPSSHDLRGLIATLAEHVRDRPNDPRGWTLLGRGYLTLGDASDAAAAFRRAIPVTAAADRSQIYSAYGEALTLGNGGAVSAEAEEAFAAALRSRPKDFAARYYLGLAYADRHDTAKALVLWKSLLADAPANAPWRAQLLDRVALLAGQSGSAPNVSFMVNSLALRLQKNPNDPEGWQRLIRAYAVMGDTAKAQQALDNARSALKRDSGAIGYLALEARELKLEK